MTFTDKEYFEVIQKNETVKEAYESIKKTCVNLQKKQIALKKTLKIF